MINIINSTLFIWPIVDKLWLGKIILQHYIKNHRNIVHFYEKRLEMVSQLANKCYKLMLKKYHTNIHHLDYLSRIFGEIEIMNKHFQCVLCRGFVSCLLTIANKYLEVHGIKMRVSTYNIFRLRAFSWKFEIRQKEGYEKKSQWFYG